MASLRIGGVLVAEPDRGGSMFDLGPRLLMNLQDVPATEVVQPGSRLSYRMLLAGDNDELEALKEALPLQPNYRWASIRESSSSIGNALDRAESFLLLGLLGVLLAGVAVGLSAHRYAQRHFDHVGVLKTLGATPGQILRGFMGLLLLVGSVAILFGPCGRRAVASCDSRGAGAVFAGSSTSAGIAAVCARCGHRFDLRLGICHACLCASQECRPNASDSP